MKSNPVGRLPLPVVLTASAVALGLLALFATPATAREVPVKPDWLESANPLSGNPEAIEAGAKLYFTFCVACHGVKADGVSRFGEYAGNLTKFWRGFGEFLAIVSAGKPKNGMPPWAEFLTGEQIMQIGSYLETQAIQDAGVNWK